MFLFLLSALCSAAATRAESRYSRFMARVCYGTATVVVGLILYLLFRQQGVWVVSDFFEGILLSILVLGAVYALLEWRFSLPADPGFLSVACIILGAVAFVRFWGQPREAALPKELSAHTLFMFLALAAFSVSFVFSVLFLLQERAIKKKRIGNLFLHLPPLEITGRLNFSFLTVGTAALSAGLFSGMAYLRGQGGPGPLLQPTAVLSFVLLAVYVVILTLRIGPLERSRRAAFVSILSYSLLLLTFLSAHAVSGTGGLG